MPYLYYHIVALSPAVYLTLIRGRKWTWCRVVMLHRGSLVLCSDCVRIEEPFWDYYDTWLDQIVTISTMYVKCILQ